MVDIQISRWKMKMAKNSEIETIIKNVDTRVRRAWIESALDSVRAHLSASAFMPSTIESLGHEASTQDIRRPAEVAAEAPARPRLYLAWSAGQRRSGT
jgi:hypothetical protein